MVVKVTIPNRDVSHIDQSTSNQAKTLTKAVPDISPSPFMFIFRLAQTLHQYSISWEYQTKTGGGWEDIPLKTPVSGIAEILKIPGLWLWYGNKYAAVYCGSKPVSTGLIKVTATIDTGTKILKRRKVVDVSEGDPHPDPLLYDLTAL